MHYVYSTLSAGVNYANYQKLYDINVKTHHVAIAGGANVANKHFVTPQGVVTEVSDSDMDFLLQHPTFKFHVEKGFITHNKKEIRVEKAIENMESKDKSAPKSKADFKDVKVREN